MVNSAPHSSDAKSPTLQPRSAHIRIIPKLPQPTGAVDEPLRDVRSESRHIICSMIIHAAIVKAMHRHKQQPVSCLHGCAAAVARQKQQPPLPAVVHCHAPAGCCWTPTWKELHSLLSPSRGQEAQRKHACSPEMHARAAAETTLDFTGS